MELGEVAIERPQVAALDEDVAAAAKHDGAEAVPLRLVEERAAGRELVGQLRQHRLDRRLDAEAAGRIVCHSEHGIITGSSREPGAVAAADPARNSVRTELQDLRTRGKQACS